MSYKASLIAGAFVKKGIENNQFVTQMKLQKMVFFAHGYHLAKYGTPLIDEIFEAWRFGPVIDSIYGEYKSFGNSLITQLPANLSHTVGTLNAAARDAIEYTWSVTKGLSGFTLSKWTHKPGSPWATSYRPNVMSIPISNEKIKDYFTALLAKNVVANYE